MLWKILRKKNQNKQTLLHPEDFSISGKLKALTLEAPS